MHVSPFQGRVEKRARCALVFCDVNPSRVGRPVQPTPPGQSLLAGRGAGCRGEGGRAKAAGVREAGVQEAGVREAGQWRQGCGTQGCGTQGCGTQGCGRRALLACPRPCPQLPREHLCSPPGGPGGPCCPGSSPPPATAGCAHLPREATAPERYAHRPGSQAGSNGRTRQKAGRPGASPPRLLPRCLSFPAGTPLGPDAVCVSPGLAVAGEHRLEPGSLPSWPLFLRREVGSRGQKTWRLIPASFLSAA